jgi:hypothetical protein
LRVRNISTMFGRCERGWRELWAQSCVSARAGIVSVDEAPQALFLLKNYAFAKTRQLGDVRRNSPRLIARWPQFAVPACVRETKLKYRKKWPLCGATEPRVEGVDSDPGLTTTHPFNGTTDHHSLGLRTSPG